MNSKNVKNCKKIVSLPMIVLKEKKSVYRAINSQRINVSKYKVDGCIYKSNNSETRCDYLLDANKKLYFIELKGSDVKKGIEQVLISIKNLKQYFNHNSINARIITTRGTTPKRLNTYTEYRNLLKLIGKEKVVVGNSPFEEHIN